MKQRLQRILSILCVLALAAGCMVTAAFAEEEKAIKIITVQWSDRNNFEGQRPTEVLAKIGTAPSTQSFILNDANNWTAETLAAKNDSWLVLVDDGRNYTVSYSGTDVVVATLSYPVNPLSQSASVVWYDNDNAAGLRPESVRINLMANGKIFRAPQEAKAENWTVSWEDLPSKNSEGPITYSIEAPDRVPGYTLTQNGATLTYTLETGKLALSASVSGVPDGKSADSLKLTVTGPDPIMPVELTYGDLAGGTIEFDNVIPGAYVVQESNGSTLFDGYVLDPAGSRVGDAVYVKPGESATLIFKYSWKKEEALEPNEHPEESEKELSFEIIGPDPRLPMTITYDKFDTDGTYTLENLHPGFYAVIERNPEGLVKAYSLTSKSTTGKAITIETGKGTATLFNQYKQAPLPVEGKVDIPVVKIWNDNGNKDGNRPGAITVILKANGKEIQQYTLTAAEDWQHTFAGLEAYDTEGKEITYSVEEGTVEWYTAEINGTYITNNYKPEVTSTTVVKLWDDKNNAIGIRPTTLAVTLKPVGDVYILNEANGWSVTVDNLPKKLNGQAVSYEWTEQEVVGYVNTNTSKDGATTTFTNRARRIPRIPADMPQPKLPGETWFVFEEYDTALGGEILINHVGDCFD